MQQIGHSDESLEFVSSVGNFVRTRQAYYGREFQKIQAATRFPWSWNGVAALTGRSGAPPAVCGAISGCS